MNAMTYALHIQHRMYKAIQKNIFFLGGNQESRQYLGRWAMEYCQTALDNKITHANEDNCGSCGNTLVSKKLARAEQNMNNAVKLMYSSSKQNNYTKYIQHALHKRIANDKT